MAVKDLATGNESTGGRWASGSRRWTSRAGRCIRRGGSLLLVYESSYGGANEATAASWQVGDIEQEISELTAKGVSFEHYDLPGATRQGAVHVLGSLKAAWFKDPDGNILNIVSR